MTRHREDCMHCRMNALAFSDEQCEFVAEMMSVVSGVTWSVATGRKAIRKPPGDAVYEMILVRAYRAWSLLFGTLIPESDEVAQHRHEHGDDR